MKDRTLKVWSPLKQKWLWAQTVSVGTLRTVTSDKYFALRLTYDEAETLAERSGYGIADYYVDNAIDNQGKFKMTCGR